MITYYCTFQIFARLSFLWYIVYGETAAIGSTQIYTIAECIMSDKIIKKECTKCSELKPISEFYKKKTGKYGVSGRCKICSSEDAKEWAKNNRDKVIANKKIYNSENRERYRELGKIRYWENREKLLEESKIYNHENKEKIRSQRKDYRLRNKDKISDEKKKYNQENKEAIKARKKIHYEKNKTEILAKNKEYYEENKDRIIEVARLNINKRNKTDLEFRIRNNIRSRILCALKGKNAYKNHRTDELLGCTIAECIKHLEKQFTKGMTWENHGKSGWEIDHRLPCASFNLLDPEEQKACFHFTNLQPMWLIDNIKKADKILYLI